MAQRWHPALLHLPLRSITTTQTGQRKPIQAVSHSEPTLSYPLKEIPPPMPSVPLKERFACDSRGTTPETANEPHVLLVSPSLSIREIGFQSHHFKPNREGCKMPKKGKKTQPNKAEAPAALAEEPEVSGDRRFIIHGRE